MWKRGMATWKTSSPLLATRETKIRTTTKKLCCDFCWFTKQPAPDTSEFHVTQSSRYPVCGRCSDPPCTLKGWRTWCSWHIRGLSLVSWPETPLYKHTDTTSATNLSQSQPGCVGAHVTRAAYRPLLAPELPPRFRRRWWFSSSGCQAGTQLQVRHCSTSLFWKSHVY